MCLLLAWLGGRETEDAAHDDKRAGVQPRRAAIPKWNGC